MQVTPFGRELKRLRARQALSVRDLALRLGKSVGYIGNMETRGEIPTRDVVIEIARIFGEDPDKLVSVAKQTLLTQAEREIAQRYQVQPRSRVQALDSSLESQEVRSMCTVVSLVNMKGGVGKTTLAMQLAHAADKEDLKVLAVDLDPQSNLSQALMTPTKYVAHLRANRPTVVQIFDDYVPAGNGSKAPKKLDVESVIVRNVGAYVGSTLDVIPSRLELSRTLKNPTGKERRLAKALAQVQDQYDLIIIDCAPTESILTEAAYFASRYIIVPIKPEFLATIGLPLLARSLNEFQLENEDHVIEIAGLVFNHSSSYSSGPEGQQSIEDVSNIASKEDWYVCEHQMRYSASYAKSAREGTPIGLTSYARGDVITGFGKLKDEIFDILGLTKVAG